MPQAVQRHRLCNSTFLLSSLALMQWLSDPHVPLPA